MMNRDFDIFPKDGTGDALWRMCSSGDDLSKPREFDFTVIFPSEQAALQFAVAFLKKSHKVSMSPREGGHKLFAWQVAVHPVLMPIYADIVEFENLLKRAAVVLGGKNDGWGCFEQS